MYQDFCSGGVRHLCSIRSQECLIRWGFRQFEIWKTTLLSFWCYYSICVLHGSLGILQTGVVIRGMYFECNSAKVGGTCQHNIHVNASTQSSLYKHWIVKRWSLIFISLVSGSKVVADQCTCWHCYKVSPPYHSPLNMPNSQQGCFCILYLSDVLTMWHCDMMNGELKPVRLLSCQQDFNLPVN